MKLVLSHPTGNQFVRALLASLFEQGLLTEFDTTVATNAKSHWLKLLPGNLRQELLRRTYPIPLNQIQSYPVRELARMALPKLGLKKPMQHETGWASVDAVYRHLDNRVADRLSRLKSNHNLTAVYAYEDGAAATFTAARQLGLTCFYDLPIGYWRAAQQLLLPETERWPDWAATLPGMRDSAEKLARKDEELQVADQIFVASKFTAKTLTYFRGRLAPVKVVPYGFPVVVPGREYVTPSSHKPLKLLFVGGLSQRKGIADVFAAVKVFGQRVELTVIGQKIGDNCPALNEALGRHRWIPGLPHHQILKLMREHDVLLFPSLFEGFGMVITEAMAQGTPVITTERTAGPDFIEHGHNGWLIQAGSTDALINAIEQLLLKPEIVVQNGKAAMDTAGNRPWKLYGQQLADLIIRFN